VIDWARRYEKLQRRALRWSKPDLGFSDRAAAWLDMLVADHGVLRAAYLNLHRIDPQAYRSAQPLPHQLRALAASGVRTVINLRGGRAYGSWPLERQACDAAGLALIQFPLRARALPSRASLLGFASLLDRIAYPVLFHCKSGSDRTGLAAALYLLLRRDASLANARRQLAASYGHLAFTHAGVLDALLDAYEREGAGRSFLDWIRTGYDPDAIDRGFVAPGIVRGLVRSVTAGFGSAQPRPVGRG
jgi:protein tyrosine phosphatase (PTP) superfamily phosphohydrolase (DUF442 family)